MATSIWLKQNFFLFLCVLSFIFLRLWLIQAQDVVFLGSFTLDDDLFIQNAVSIRHTGWLGNYSQVTLAKGPFYPLFLAAVSLSGAPLLLVQNCLYICAIALFSFVLSPLIQSKRLTVLLFLLLLFQPASLDSDVTSRISRSGIGLSLNILIFSGLLRVATSSLSQKQSILWGTCTGLLLSFFWMNREDNIWMVPAITLIIGGTWIYQIMRSANLRPLFTYTSGLICFFSLPIVAVSILNTIHYQIFTVTEFQHPAFPSAYGALLRVRPKQRLPLIPVTASTRKLLYSLSPSFQKIEKSTEGWSAPDWAVVSAEETGMPASEREVAGGYWMWSLRASVSSIGSYESGLTAAIYYYQLAHEVNQLCDQKILSCTPPKHDFLPPLHSEELIKVAKALPKAFVEYFYSPDFYAYNNKSDEDNYEKFNYTYITHEELFKNEISHEGDQFKLKHIQLMILQKVIQTYQLLVIPFLTIGAIAYGFLLLKRDRFAFIYFGVLASAASLQIIVVLITATSFYSIWNQYLYSIYPLYLTASFMSLIRVRQYFKKS